MEYKKIINLLYNAAHQPYKFKKKSWIEINDESRGTYNKDNQIRFKTLMLGLCFCDYILAYIIVNGTITVAKDRAATPNNDNKKVIF